MKNVAVRNEGPIRTIAIDRETQRNALDRATLAELEVAFRDAAADSSVRVILLRGAGDKAFCAGADLKEVLGHASIDESRAHFGGVARVIGAMEEAPQPVIARVPGFALAGGCGLAVAADFTIAGESAVLGLPEISLGLLPLMVSVPILRAVGSRKVLLDLVLTGPQGRRPRSARTGPGDARPPRRDPRRRDREAVRAPGGLLAPGPRHGQGKRSTPRARWRPGRRSST